jgi:hypothetical protein
MMHAIRIEQTPNRFRPRFTRQEDRVELTGEQSAGSFGWGEFLVWFAVDLVSEAKDPEQRVSGRSSIASWSAGKNAFAP